MVVQAAPLTDWRRAYEATPLRSSAPAGQRTRVLIVLPIALPVTNEKLSGANAVGSVWSSAAAAPRRDP